MFRNKQEVHDSDDSGDEDKLPLESDNMGEPAAKKTNSVWSDAVLVQSLEERGSLMALERGDRVRRGVETFEIPSKIIAETPERIREIMKVPASQPSSEDPFGDIADLSGVEGFGVADTAKHNDDRRVSAPFRGRRGRAHFHQPSRVSKVPAQHEAQETSEAKEGTGGDRLKGRGRGQFWQDRGDSGSQTLKRNWSGEVKVGETFTPVICQVSMEKLMATEIPTGLPLPELGAQIAEALGESDGTTVTKIVTSISEAKAISLFEKTKRIESGDGLKVFNGSRRRTPGGVFIFLFRKDQEILFSVKNSVFGESLPPQRTFQRGRRRMNFSDKLDQVSELLKKDTNANSVDGDVQLAEVDDEPSSEVQMEKPDADMMP